MNIKDLGKAAILEKKLRLIESQIDAVKNCHPRLSLPYEYIKELGVSKSEMLKYGEIGYSETGQPTYYMIILTGPASLEVNILKWLEDTRQGILDKASEIGLNS